jgi:hypothetical protein
MRAGISRKCSRSGRRPRPEPAPFSNYSGTRLKASGASGLLDHEVECAQKNLDVEDARIAALAQAKSHIATLEVPLWHAA